MRFMTTEPAVNEAPVPPNDDTLESELPELPMKMSGEELEAKLSLLRDTLAYHDLDTYTPAGWVRSALCLLHDSTGLPWWQTIAVGVLVGRLITVPSLLANSRNTAVMMKHRPHYDRLREKMSEARATGDQIQMQLAQMEMSQFDKKNNMAVMKRMKSYIVPVVYFASFFIALKRMTSAPIESMKTGGFFWMQDLTVADPTWCLPIAFASTLFFTLRTGMDVPAVSMGRLKNYLMIGVPVITFIFSSNFASGVVWYWICSNIFTLILALSLRVPYLRRLARLPPRPKRAPLNQTLRSSIPSMAEIRQAAWQIPYLPAKLYRLAVAGWKDSRVETPPSDMDIMQKDAENFRKAGRGPVIATYAYNPREKFPEAFAAKQKPRWLRMFSRN